MVADRLTAAILVPPDVNVLAIAQRCGIDVIKTNRKERLASRIDKKPVLLSPAEREVPIRLLLRCGSAELIACREMSSD
jgi:hypothetical protein